MMKMGGERMVRCATRLLMLLLGLVVLHSFSPTARTVKAAGVIYVSQAGAGAQNGTNAANAFAMATVLANCSTDAPAGTVVKLTGTGSPAFSYAAGTVAGINWTCGGASGNPVVITVDTSASLPIIISSPGFSYGNGSATCCGLYINASYVTVDGGLPCGTTPSATGPVASANACQLVVEDTGEGTAYDAINVGGMIDSSRLVGVNGGTGVEIKNISMLNSYVQLPPWQLSSVSWSGTTATVTCSAACPVGANKFIAITGNTTTGADTCQPGVTACTIVQTTANNAGGSSFTATLLSGIGTGTASGGWAIDNWGNGNGEIQSNFDSGCIASAAPGLLIHDSICAHGGWLIFISQPVLGGAAIQVYNNQLFDFDHAIAEGVCSAGSCSDNNAYAGVIAHDNLIGGSFNWDQLFDPSNRNLNDSGARGPNNNHHDPIHTEIDLSHTTQRYLTNPTIYDNSFTGDPGVDTNCVMFLRASSTGEAVFNNLINFSNSRPWSGTFCIGDGNSGASPISFTTNPLLFNNTLVPSGNYTGSGGVIGATGNTGSAGEFGFQYLNNIFGTLHFGVNIYFPCSGCWQSAPGGWDYNYYVDGHTDSGGVAVDFVTYNFGFSTETLAPVGTSGTWQYYLTNTAASSVPLGTGSPYPTTQGRDLNSLQGTFATLNLASSGQPNTGSPALAAGLNLTGLCSGLLTALCNDIAHVQRPASGPWDIGAYQVTQPGFKLETVTTAGLAGANSGAVATATNTTTETSICSFMLPASELGEGQEIKLHCEGVVQWPLTRPSVVITLRAGGTSGTPLGSFTLGFTGVQSSNLGFTCDFSIAANNTPGGSTPTESQGGCWVPNPSGTGILTSGALAKGSTVSWSTDIANEITIDATWNAASSSSIMEGRLFDVIRLN
jgi:hypothetical protein